MDKVWQSWWNELETAEQSLQSKSGKSTSHVQGASAFNRTKSGEVKLLSNQTATAGKYGGKKATYVKLLQIGNGIEGDALKEAEAIFEKLAASVKTNDLDVTRGDGSISVSSSTSTLTANYEYGSSFCWVGFKVDKH